MNGDRNGRQAEAEAAARDREQRACGTEQAVVPHASVRAPAELLVSQRRDITAIRRSARVSLWSAFGQIFQIYLHYLRLSGIIKNEYVATATCHRDEKELIMGIPTMLKAIFRRKPNTSEIQQTQQDANTPTSPAARNRNAVPYGTSPVSIRS